MGVGVDVDVLLPALKLSYVYIYYIATDATGHGEPNNYNVLRNGFRVPCIQYSYVIYWFRVFNSSVIYWGYLYIILIYSLIFIDDVLYTSAALVPVSAPACWNDLRYSAYMLTKVSSPSSPLLVVIVLSTSVLSVSPLPMPPSPSPGPLTGSSASCSVKAQMRVAIPVGESWVRQRSSFMRRPGEGFAVVGGEGIGV